MVLIPHCCIFTTHYVVSNIQCPPKVWRQPVIFLLPSITKPCPIKLKKNSYAFSNTLTECFTVMNNYLTNFIRVFNFTMVSGSQALEKSWLFSVPLHPMLIL